MRSSIAPRMPPGAISVICARALSALTKATMQMTEESKCCMILSTITQPRYPNLSVQLEHENLPPFALHVVPGQRADPERGQVSRDHQRCEVSVRLCRACRPRETWGHHRNQYPRRVRQRAEEAWRQAKH